MGKKQVIVMRKDLNMRKGKMIAQGAHASLKAILDEGYQQSAEIGLDVFCIPLSNDLNGWLNGTFKKICVSVNSEEELMTIYEIAAKEGIPCSLIKDSGLTEFSGVPTLTCCAIGPSDDDTIDRITGHLTLL